jgi:hypothetical protein
MVETIITEEGFADVAVFTNESREKIQDVSKKALQI